MSGRTGAGPIAAVALSALSAGCATAEALPAPKVAYCADVSLRAAPLDGGAVGLEGRGRSCYAEGKRRRELVLPGRDEVLIERTDLGVRWLLAPGGATASEVPIARWPRGAAPDPTGSWRGDVTLDRRGREQVNGVLADRYEVTAKSGRGTAWLTEENVPVRYEGTFRHGGTPTRVSVDYTNIRVGPQDPALFELPEGVEARSAPLSTHGPGTDRKKLQEELRRERSGARD